MRGRGFHTISHNFTRLLATKPDRGVIIVRAFSARKFVQPDKGGAARGGQTLSRLHYKAGAGRGEGFHLRGTNRGQDAPCKPAERFDRVRLLKDLGCLTLFTVIGSGFWNRGRAPNQGRGLVEGFFNV
jgi:hypothetical protein